MGQVPVRYGLVGSGHLAKHLAHYFQLLQIPFISWSRKGSTSIDELKNIDIILLAISDRAIEKFITDHKGLSPKKWIHFSGALTTSLAQSFHPLMTFGDDLYDLSVYQNMVFVGEPSPSQFEDIFPQLPNHHFILSSNYRGLYHSLCVMSGNFTVLLWEKFFKYLEGTFNIPKAAAYPYLKQVCANLMNEKTGSVLTGPLARNDKKTIEANLTSLKTDSYHEVYKAFVAAFKKDTTKTLRRDHEQHP